MTRRFLPDPRRSLPCLLLLGWLALAGARWAAGADDTLLPAGEGQPFTQSWTSRDYHAPGGCLCFAQDARGVMYLGSKGAVLEYDGPTWRSVPTGDAGDTLSLGYDAGADTVYVGREDDLGYLKLEPGGAHTYVSLRDQVPPEARNVGRFSAVFATPQGVFFVGSDTVLRWREGRFKAWKLPATVQLHGHWVAGRLYVATSGMGLRRLEGEEFVSASDDPIFHQVDVYALLSGADGTLLLGSNRRGFFVVRDGVATKLDSECDAFFKEKGIITATRLRDGSLAVGTINGGVVILDPALRFRCRLDRTSGLSLNYAGALFEDAEGGLWVHQGSGTVRVEVASPLSVYRAGPDEEMSNSASSARWHGAMALGNSNGVFRVVPADPATAASPRLERLTENVSAGGGMCEVPNGVLVINSGNLEFLNHERKVTRVLEKKTAVQITASRAHPGRVYFLTQPGRIGTLRFDEAAGKWVEDGTVAELGVTSRFLMVESPAGDLWVGTNEHGVFRVRIDPTGAAAVTPFHDAPGPLHGVGLVWPCKGGGGPLVLKTRHGLYRFDEATGAVVGLTAFGEELQDGSMSIDECVSYDARSLWVTCQSARDPQAPPFRGRIVAGGPGNAPTRQALPHQVEALVGAIRFFRPVEQAPEELRSLLVIGATGNGVVRVDVAKWEAAINGTPRAFATLIRRAFTTQGEGSTNVSPILAEPLPYARNTVHFEFAAGTLALAAAPRYQTRLGGFGAGEWSEWTERSSVDYLNLPEGRYAFEVRARTSDDQLGKVASLPFRVLPPWQRSPGAYAGYALVAAMGLYALVRWRGRQLRRRNVVLETLVDARTSELRGREAELVRARDEADAANRAKSAFLANMSHELRTPLNAILGYSQILLGNGALPARSREQIAVIDQSGEHLLVLINEVLDISKVEAGKLTLNAADFPLGSLLDEAGAAFRPRMTEKGLAFQDERGADLPVFVHTDRDRLRQVLFNLLSNAVKFTRAGSVRLEVGMAGEADGRAVRFAVTDTGVGIAEGELANIFEAFHQVSDRSLAAQGTGLGLAISRHLVRLLGGPLRVESRLGEGSRFWFDLPLAAATAMMAGDENAAPAVNAGAITGCAGAVRRLLVVDDQPENRRVLRDMLAPLGFAIDEARDGTDCLEQCARGLPDAVLLDLRMGTPDGFEVARTLRGRAEAGAPRLVIVALSASVFASDRQQALDAGCDDFLPKPFRTGQILAVLGHLLGLRWVQAEAGPTTSETGRAVGTNAIPTEELDGLLELSRRGDVMDLRKQLEAWGADEATPGHASLARQLMPLVVGFQIDELHARLLELRGGKR